MGMERERETQINIIMMASDGKEKREITVAPAAATTDDRTTTGPIYNNLGSVYYKYSRDCCDRRLDGDYYVIEIITQCPPPPIKRWQ